MPLNGFSINTSGSPRRLAQRDTEAFWRALLAVGGTDINANNQVTVIAAAVSSIYEAVPRSSVLGLWLTAGKRNVGSGSKVIGVVGPRATLVNGLSWGEDGVSGSSSGYINLGPSGVSGTAPQTMLAVVKWTSASTISPAAAMGTGGYLSDRLLCNHSSTSGISSYRVSGGTSVSAPAITFANDTLHSITGTFTGSAVSQYRNGTQKQTASGGSDILVATDLMCLGNWNASGNGGGGGEARIVANLSIAASDAQVIALHAAVKLLETTLT